MKYNDTLPTYESIDPNISTEKKNQGDERTTQEYLDSLGLAQRQIYCKEGNQIETKN